MSSGIEISGIYKGYGAGSQRVEVLEGASLTVCEGDFVAVMGPSGVGKSTLLHILGVIDRPDRGQVLHGGEDVSALNERELDRFRNRHVGFVFQFHYLLPEFTALENVAMPCLIQGRKPETAYSRASQLLEDVELSHRAAHKPGELSGGEQQRVAIARALAAQPKVLLADEPTGNLDARTGEMVFALFRRLHEDRKLTSVVVTHNETLAKACSKVFIMDRGLIREA